MAPLELITGMPHLQMELDVIRQKLVHMQPRSQSVAVNPPDLRSLFPKRFHQWQWLQPVAVPPVAMSTIWFHLRYPQLRIPRYPQLRIPTPGSTSTMFHMWHLGSSGPRGYTEVPRGYTEVPQGYTEVPRGYTEVPRGYTEVPRKKSGSNS